MKKALASDLEDRKLIMFGGKGGVGKTTCASSLALTFADRGQKTLIVSSDPTPSLSDIFEYKIGDEIRQIPNVKNLFVLELSYDKIIEMWKEKFGEEVYEVISSFLPVGREILDYLAGAPGIDEEFMLAYILDLVENGEFDKIVWDTAPAGHTLSLLRLESRFYDHLTEAARLYTRIYSYLDKLREMVKPKTRRSPMGIIEEWKELARKVVNLLSDWKTTEFIVVTIPEALGVYQTDRIIKELEAYGIKVNKVVVNYVIPKSACNSDYLSSRFKVQLKYIEMLQERYGEEMLMFIPLLPYEVKGIEKLRKFSKYLNAKIKNLDLVEIENKA